MERLSTKADGQYYYVGRGDVFMRATDELWFPGSAHPTSSEIPSISYAGPSVSSEPQYCRDQHVGELQDRSTPKLFFPSQDMDHYQGRNERKHIYDRWATLHSSICGYLLSSRV
jgi:hypothetical protein